jgi:hypothetical protein
VGREEEDEVSDRVAPRAALSIAPKNKNTCKNSNKEPKSKINSSKGQTNPARCKQIRGPVEIKGYF